MGITPEKKDSILNEKLLRQAPNRLSLLLPGSESYTGMIHVVDTTDICSDCSILLHADTFEQKGIVFLSRENTES
jgi:hypothetical protein